MTNEEIEKRFQFDLAMGLFYRTTKVEDDNEIAFIDVLFSDCNNLDKLIHILKNIGYHRMPFSNKTKPVETVLIYPERKRYIGSSRNIQRILRNRLPKYILEYTVQEDVN